jgi:predicted enzyme related to lactoylglutathione lyase
MGQPVVHFEIVGAKDETLHPFYSEMFGWSIDKDNPVGYGIVDRESNLSAEGIGIGGGIMGTRGMQNMPEDTSYVTVYVEVPDVEAALAKAEQLGGQRVMGPMEVPGGPELGMFSDPEGHLIGVVRSQAQD